MSWEVPHEDCRNRVKNKTKNKKEAKMGKQMYNGNKKEKHAKSET